MTTKAVTPHYHVWTRAGRIFRMHPREYSDKSNARRAAVKLAPEARDRLVLACHDCPPAVRSKRPQHNKLARLGHPERVTLSHRLADQLDIPIGRARAALDTALDNPRSRPTDATPQEARRILRQIARVTA